MATIRGTIEHNSGIPLGGIGTGSVEIRPDGYFHEWQIFNLGAWAPKQPECCKAEPPAMPPGALSFFVRVETPGRPPLMRRLGLRTDQHNLYSFAWLPSVRGIEFEGRYPIARLRYLDEDLPVTVEALLFSPFVPHDARTTGTPGFHAVFHVTNRAAQPVRVSLLATLRNPLAWGAEDRKLVNRAARAGKTAFLTLRTEAEMDCNATAGSLGLSVTGGDPSWVAGDFNEYFHGYWGLHQGPVGITYSSLLHDFLAEGRLPSLPADRSPAALLRLNDDEIAALPLARRKALLAELRHHPFVHSMLRRIEALDPRWLRTADGLTEVLKDIRTRLDQRLAGKERKNPSWGAAALASSVTLARGQEEDVRYTFAWHFPHHYSAKGPDMGHQYENWFRDAEDVSLFLVKNYAEHRRKTVSFADALFDTSLPPELPDAWAGQLTTIPKCTWWTKNGDFGVWEGLGCCGFHTTDITYQGSFGLLALFPQLQKAQMVMGARFQREDGRVHHFFTPDLTAVDKGFDRVDMNQQFVLLVCRDYLWTGDRAFLRGLWPNIVRAMDNTAELDGDGDGLPDHDTRRNTYDGWNFTGTPSYIASLWVAALVAAVRIAEELGEKSRAARWRTLLRKAAASFEKKLWNGEYYSLWVEGKERDECCMTDQVDGEWFTNLIGLGHALPRERIRAALQAVLRHNFTQDGGLINASYPPNAKPRLCTHDNAQAMAPWTGIEYAIASMMMDFGLVREGLSVVRSIHDRYERAGRFWNHVECGDHYYRAMSSWAILLAVTGFKVDVPRGVLTVAPVFVQRPLQAPWVAATGWGSFRQTDEDFQLTCLSGTLRVRELRLNVARPLSGVSVNGRKAAARVSVADGLQGVRLARDLTLRTGDMLVAG